MHFHKFLSNKLELLLHHETPSKSLLSLQKQGICTEPVVRVKAFAMKTSRQSAKNSEGSFKDANPAYPKWSWRFPRVKTFRKVKKHKLPKRDNPPPPWPLISDPAAWDVVDLISTESESSD